jgi:hypothetical protein
LFTQSSPVCNLHCYKLSPFQAHWGRWHCSCFLLPACLFTVHMGSGPSPSFVKFPSHRHFYKLSCSWLLGGATPPAFSGGLFIYSSVSGCPSHPSVLRAPHPLCYMSFLLLLLIFQFFLFSLCGGQSVWGAMLIWPRVVCGSSMCHLAHLVVCVFPSSLGAGIWWCRIPPGFSV